MERIARNRKNDPLIRRELEAAGIPVIEIDQDPMDPFPSGVAGKLGPFIFRRTELSYDVHGDMPLASVKEMRASRIGQELVELVGLGRGREPEDCAKYKDENGATLLPIMSSISDRMRLEMEKGEKSVRYVANPRHEGQPCVSHFIIRLPDGLAFFARFIKTRML